MSARPRILYLAPRYLWPFDRGDRLRGFRLVEQMARHADVTLVGMTEGPAEAQDLGPLAGLCARVEVVQLTPLQSRLNMVRGLFGALPLQVSYYRSEVMDRLVDRLQHESFDIVFGQLFRVRPWVDRFTGSRRMLEMSDAISLTLRRALPGRPAWLRPLLAEELRRVERYEAETLRVIEEAWVVSEVDRRALLELEPRGRITVVPSGVETTWAGAALASREEKSDVLFLGNLTVNHNIDCARYLAHEIWPIVRRARPEARLWLVGAAGRAVAPLGREPGVQLPGFVADLRPILERSAAAIAPLRYGAGLQNKALETMAAGVPTVVTPQVNASIGAEPGREIIVTEGAAGLAEALVRLMADPAAARPLGEAGSRFVLARFSWDRAGERMAEILQGR